MCLSGLDEFAVTDHITTITSPSHIIFITRSSQPATRIKCVSAGSLENLPININKQGHLATINCPFSLENSPLPNWWINHLGIWTGSNYTGLGCVYRRKTLSSGLLSEEENTNSRTLCTMKTFSSSFIIYFLLSTFILFYSFAVKYFIYLLIPLIRQNNNNNVFVFLISLLCSTRL